MKHLVEIEQTALKLQNEGKHREAAILFKEITDEYPNYEFGSCFYNLAYCLEELGKYKEAEKYYLKAIDYDKEDINRLGGYASFLYLHGSPSSAFEKHIELINLEKKLGFDYSNTMLALQALGKKLGLSEEEIADKVKDL